MAKPSRKKASNRSRKPRSLPAPKPVDVVTTAPEPEAEAATAPAVQAEQEPATAPVPAVAGPDARSQEVTLGPVVCRMRRVPVDTVLGLLSPDGLRRIEAEKHTPSFESVRQRLLATDGRATPAVFEASADVGGKPTILHGYAEIAAAQVCGVPDIPVILVPAGGASEAQAYIVEMVRKERMRKETPDDDDELFYRVNAED